MKSELNYGAAIEALKKGKCVTRKDWEDKNLFVCKQVSATIDNTIIPKMQSLPQTAKDLLLKTSSESIRYNNQMIIIKNNTEGIRNIDSWIASSSDTFAEDWYILD